MAEPRDPEDHRPPHRRREDFDRDFDRLVSGLDLDGGWEGRTGVEPPDLRSPDLTSPDLTSPGRRPDAPTPLTGDWLNLGDALERAEPDEADPSEWKPEPLPARRLSNTAFAALACLGGCLAVLVGVVLGWRPPAVIGWLAVALFGAAIWLGWRTLPRDRDPDEGDGAVL